MKKKLDDREWTKLAEKNAKHIAKLHIESENIEKIAGAFKDTAVATALEFLFTEADRHRKLGNIKKAGVILEAATLIDRKTGDETELTLETAGEGKKQETTLIMRRHTPKEIFDSPIED